MGNFGSRSATSGAVWRTIRSSGSHWWSGPVPAPVRRRLLIGSCMFRMRVGPTVQPTAQSGPLHLAPRVACVNKVNGRLLSSCKHQSDLMCDAPESSMDYRVSAMRHLLSGKRADLGALKVGDGAPWAPDRSTRHCGPVDAARSPPLSIPLGLFTEGPLGPTCVPITWSLDPPAVAAPVALPTEPKGPTQRIQPSHLAEGQVRATPSALSAVSA